MTGWPCTLRSLRRLAGDQAGVTITEFAIIAPVFLVMVIGMFDVGQRVYSKSVLDGAVQAAARGSSLEGSDTAAADAIVLDTIRRVMPGVEIQSTRTSYYDFADIERSERWNDSDDSGQCDNGEAYTDENRNGQWDSDIGLLGNGGANDVVMYTVSATYDPLFKTPFFPEDWAVRTLVSSAIRKNQPYADQASYSATAGTCD